MIGIYKITNPAGKVYIGESKNIENRWTYYKHLRCKKQPRLYNSLKYYGYKNHKFEILTLCYFEQLKLIERDFQEAYDVIGKMGLNCLLTNTSEKKTVFTLDTRLKISKASKGRIFSKEHRENISKCQIGRFYSIETRNKISRVHKNKIISEVTKEKMSNSSKIAMKVVCTNTNKTWNSIQKCAIELGYKPQTLQYILTKKKVNHTTIKFLKYE